MCYLHILLLRWDFNVTIKLQQKPTRKTKLFIKYPIDCSFVANYIFFNVKSHLLVCLDKRWSSSLMDHCYTRGAANALSVFFDSLFEEPQIIRQRKYLSREIIPHVVGLRKEQTCLHGLIMLGTMDTPYFFKLDLHQLSRGSCLYYLTIK